MRCQAIFKCNIYQLYYDVLIVYYSIGLCLGTATKAMIGQGYSVQDLYDIQLALVSTVMYSVLLIKYVILED